MVDVHPVALELGPLPEKMTLVFYPLIEGRRVFVRRLSTCKTHGASLRSSDRTLIDETASPRFAMRSALQPVKAIADYKGNVQQECCRHL